MTDPSAPRDDRRILVIAHTGRPEARVVAGEFCVGLHKFGIAVRLLEKEAAELERLLGGERPGN